MTSSSPASVPQELLAVVLVLHLLDRLRGLVDEGDDLRLALAGRGELARVEVDVDAEDLRPLPELGQLVQTGPVGGLDVGLDSDRALQDPGVDPLQLGVEIRLLLVNRR